MCISFVTCGIVVFCAKCLNFSSDKSVLDMHGQPSWYVMSCIAQLSWAIPPWVGEMNTSKDGMLAGTPC